MPLPHLPDDAPFADAYAFTRGLRDLASGLHARADGNSDRPVIYELASRAQDLLDWLAGSERIPRGDPVTNPTPEEQMARVRAWWETTKLARKQ